MPRARPSRCVQREADFTSRLAVSRRLPALPSRCPAARFPSTSRTFATPTGPDSAVQAGVPVGTTIESDWNARQAYTGTSRKFGMHVPAQYDPSEPASLMVFQDGQWYLDPNGEVRGGIVLDNLS